MIRDVTMLSLVRRSLAILSRPQIASLGQGPLVHGDAHRARGDALAEALSATKRRKIRERHA